MLSCLEFLAGLWIQPTTLRWLIWIQVVLPCQSLCSHLVIHCDTSSLPAVTQSKELLLSSPTLTFFLQSLCTCCWYARNSLLPHCSPDPGLHMAGSFSFLRSQVKSKLLRDLLWIKFPGHSIIRHYMFPSQILLLIAMITYLFTYLFPSLDYKHPEVRDHAFFKVLSL